MRAWYFKLLWKGPTLLLGGAFLGGTASIPKVHNTLDPKCFDFSEQLDKRDLDVSLKLQENSTLTSEGVSTIAEGSWEDEFKQRISDALRRASANNVCYDAVTSYGTFWGWNEGETKLTRQTKDKIFRDQEMCDGKVLKRLGAEFKKIYQEIGSDLGDCQDGPARTSRAHEAETKEWSWKKFGECWLAISENGKWQELYTKSSDKFSSQDWIQYYGTDVPAEKVTVKVEMDASWGSAGWSNCSSARRKWER